VSGIYPAGNLPCDSERSGIGGYERRKRKHLNRLEAEVAGLSSVVDVLSSSPSLAVSNSRSDEDSAIVLFKAVLKKLPQADSFDVGCENGGWLQVGRLDVLDPVERNSSGGLNRSAIRQLALR